MDNDKTAADVWQREDVARGFLEEKTLALPQRGVQLDVLLRMLKHTSTPIQRVLDLGCGDGVILETVLKAHRQATGVGLDFSPPMLQRAQGRLNSMGDRVELVDADLGQPEWRAQAPGQFDAIVSGFAIHHLTDQRKRVLYGEVFSALNPGGIFVNCEHVTCRADNGEVMFNEAMAEHLFMLRAPNEPGLTQEQVFDEFINRPDRAANILATTEDQVAWLAELGFVNADCFWKWFELAVFGGHKPHR